MGLGDAGLAWSTRAGPGRVRRSLLELDAGKQRMQRQWTWRRAARWTVAADQGEAGEVRQGAGLQDDGSGRERAWTVAETSKSGHMTVMGFPVERHEL